MSNDIEPVFQAASENFNLGQITSHKRVSGNMNMNYSVVTDNGGKFILKALKKHSLEDVETEAVYLERLREHSFPAAYYIVDNSGSPIFEHKGEMIVALPELEGSPPSFTDGVCLSVGQNIARLHQIPTHDLPERSHWLRESFLPENIELVMSNFPNKAKQFRDAFDLLTVLNYSRLPKSIVHGDLYAANCLYNNDDLVAFLDWEEVGVGPAVLDLATCVFNFCFEGNTFHPDLYLTMIEGYQQVRSLDQTEQSSMGLAIRYVGLSLSSWRLAQFGIGDPSSQPPGDYEIYWNTGLNELELPSIR